MVGSNVYGPTGQIARRQRCPLRPYLSRARSMPRSAGVWPSWTSRELFYKRIGQGAVVSVSSKQKINTKSSTEAELVGVDDCIGRILSIRYFIEAQGYDVGSTTVYQDNKSAILLEKNGQSSSSKRTKHINVRYFFITDRVHRNEITIDYCPTTEMVADYFTKPLQGSLFCQLRAQVLNMPVDEFKDIVDNNDHTGAESN